MSSRFGCTAFVAERVIQFFTVSGREIGVMILILWVAFFLTGYDILPLFPRLIIEFIFVHPSALIAIKLFGHGHELFRLGMYIGGVLYLYILWILLRPFVWP